MTNETKQEELLLYWSGELDEETSRKVEARLRKDPEAVAYLAELNQLQHQVKDVPRNYPECSMIPEALASNESDGTIVPFPFWRRLVPIAVAAVIILGLGLFQLFQTEPTSAPAPKTVQSSNSALSEVTTSEDKLSNRLFSSQKRFTSSLRFEDAQERVKRIRTQLNTNSI